MFLKTYLCTWKIFSVNNFSKSLIWARDKWVCSRKNRNRRVTWFNPPWSCTVKTNIGADFLKINRECFPRNHMLYKICNRNTIKLSYRCMDNIKAYLGRHNSKILRNGQNNTVPPVCNCQRRNKPHCPLPGKCTIQSVVYMCDVTNRNTGQVETYTGVTKRKFKKRWDEHKSSFRHLDQSGHTKLSAYIWELKADNVDVDIFDDLKWSIKAQCAPFNPVTNICRLCLIEKFLILFEPTDASLNQRSEFFTTCRHKEAWLLVNS